MTSSIVTSLSRPQYSRAGGAASPDASRIMIMIGGGGVKFIPKVSLDIVLGRNCFVDLQVVFHRAVLRLH